MARDGQPSRVDVETTDVVELTARVEVEELSNDEIEALETYARFLETMFERQAVERVQQLPSFEVDE